MVIAKMIWGFPAVRAQLREYQQLLITTPGLLAQQGLESIRDKTFHCLGGSVYALMVPKRQRRQVLKFIVAFQSISDYLDNLCDRVGINSEQSFRRLHLAMLDSLEPEAHGFSNYYSLYPAGDDGGYLQRLVSDCRGALLAIPGYGRYQERLVNLTKLYIDLQSFKHLDRRLGEEALATLYERHRNQFPCLYWWEFAAACGSTLAIFAMLAAQQGAEELSAAYMPWVNGLHILLDYYIDQEEDSQHNDMNLVSYYGDRNEKIQRLLWFYHQSQLALKPIADSKFHALVLDGLLAMYLSDTKARSPQLSRSSCQLLSRVTLRARVLERLARVLRHRGVI